MVITLIVAVLLLVGGLAAGLFLNLDSNYAAARQKSAKRQSAQNSQAPTSAPVTQPITTPTPTPAPPVPVAVSQTDQAAITEAHISGTTPSDAPPVSLGVDVEEEKTTGPATEKNNTLFGQSYRNILPVPTETMQPAAPVNLEAPEPTPTAPVERPLFQANTATMKKGGTLLSNGSELKNVINLDAFMPESEEIKIILRDNIISDSTDGYVRGWVYKPRRWNGRDILQTGDEVLGTVSSGYFKNDRVRITWNKILLKDGRTLGISAVCRMPDGSPGVKGYKIGNVMLSALGPIFAEFMRGATEKLANEGTSYSNFGGVMSSMNIGEADWSQMAAAGGSSAFKKLSDLMMEDLEQNKPYVFVPAGTECRAYLTKHMDISEADYGK